MSLFNNQLMIGLQLTQRNPKQFLFLTIFRFNAIFCFDKALSGSDLQNTLCMPVEEVSQELIILRFLSIFNNLDIFSLRK